MIGFYMKLNTRLKQVKVDYDVMETTAFSSKVTVMTPSRDQVSISGIMIKLCDILARWL